VSKPNYTVLNYTHFTKTYTSLHLYTLHNPIRLKALPFAAFSWSSPHFKFPSLTSLHLSLSNPCSWKYSNSYVLQIPFTSLQFTSIHFTYHFPTPAFVNTRFPPQFEFLSRHFTYHFLTLFPKLLGLDRKVPKGEGKVPFLVSSSVPNLAIFYRVVTLVFQN
jgi:hypothetical protein